MRALFVSIAIAAFLFSCNSPSSQKQSVAGSENKREQDMEGNDYVVLKRFRVTDDKGFSQPLEVSSFLLPASWKVNSSVDWNPVSKCLPEMVQASINAASPDGDYELLLLPVTQLDWSDDPVYLDAMQKGFNLHSCNIEAPQDAAGYIRNGLAPSLKAKVVSAQTVTALQQLMDAGAAQMTQQARQAGNNAYSHRGSAAEALLNFSDGKEGLAFCTLMQTIVTLPGTQGAMANTWQCYVSMRVVIKYKTGNSEMARKIMSTFFSSTRINPTWANAVQNFFLAIGKNAQDQTWKHIQEVHAVQEQMGNNIIRNWEAKSNTAESSTASGNYTEQFGQYLRGVDNWTDESGNKVELTSGYSNAWSKGDGSYLLSNNPAFDPNVSFNESWTRMKQ